MRHTRFGLLTATCAFAGACGAADRADADAIPDRSPDAAARAESLSALDPVAEARRAILRGDLRFLAVCGYTCIPVGIDLTSSGVAILDSLRAIEGTTDAPPNDDVVRLNQTAAQYAGAYNRVIAAHRAGGTATTRP